VAEANDRIVQILEDVKARDKEIARLKSRLAAGQGDDLAARAVEVKSGVKVLAATLDGADARTLRETLDQLKNKLKSAAIVLASVEDGKVQIAAGVTQDAVGRIKAGELANFVASQVGAKAVVGPTWRWPAATIRRLCPRRSAGCRPGWPSVCKEQQMNADTPGMIVEEYDREVDARGLACPLPILRAKKALAEMQSGQILKIVCTDRGSVRDFQAFSKQTGNDLLRQLTVGAEFVHFLRRR